MKYLIIVESPAKCNKILSFLGDNYQCEATYGHLRHVNSLNSIDNHYNITFENIKEKERQIEKIRKKIKQCDEVILATDDDREGEGIAWHVMDMFNLPLETKRIKFNSIQLASPGIPLGGRSRRGTNCETPQEWGTENTHPRTVESRSNNKRCG